MVTDVQYKKHSLLFSYKILIKKDRNLFREG